MPQTKKFWLREPGFGLSLEGNIFTFERIKSEIRISKFETNIKFECSTSQNN